jgi:hypothetical protein
MTQLRLSLCAAVAAVALAGAAGPAAAAPGLLRVLQDDGTLVHGGEPYRTRARDALPELGVDVVRVNLRWSELARARPADERSSASYPGDWGPYDRIVQAAGARGVQVLFTLTTPAPSWAGRRLTARYPGARDPDPAAFGRFAAAAGRRYDGGAGSPGRVARWSIVNEPNNPRFLGPQSRAGRLHAPAQYRRLVRAALAGLRATGHPGREVLIGDLLATGRGQRGETVPIGPLPFLRELLCLDAHDRPLRGAVKGHEGCTATPARLDVGGVAVHLYYLAGGPGLRPLRSGDLTPSALGGLRRTLSAARAAGRLTGTGIWDTEGGVQSSPPDRVFGVPLARQAAFVNQTEALLWRAPGVRSYGQYLMRDEPASGTFQSGLWLRNGTRKPAYAAYRLAADVRRRTRSTVTLWARVPPGAAAAAVRVTAGTGRHRVTRRVRRLAADRTFTLVLPRRRGGYRVTAGAAAGRLVPAP